MANWNAEQYLKFRAERTQPSVDLAKRICVSRPRRILDLGCGPGNSTRVLREQFPDVEEILGVDSSPEMIARARGEQPDLNFRLFDIQNDLQLLGDEWDIIFSNACLQWVPGHRELLPRLMDAVAAGGQLAVQIPLTEEAVFYRICRELHASEPWKGLLPPQIRTFHQLTPVEYCDVLSACCDDFTIWETIYHHLLPDWQAVIEWYRGSGLRPYLAALPEDARGEFEDALLRRVRESYPRLADGRVFLRFPRLFFVASKSTRQ